MANVVMLSSGNINGANAFQRSDIASFNLGTSHNTQTVNIGTTAIQHAVTFASNHTTRGLLLEIFQANVGDNDRNVLVELQELVGATWTTRASKTLTPANIIGDVTNADPAGRYLTTVIFTSTYAVTTGAGKWRYQVTQSGGTTGTWSLARTDSTNWCWIEIDNATATFASGDLVAVGNGATLTFNVNTTINHIIIGSNGKVIFNNVTISMENGIIAPYSNSEVYGGTEASPLTAFRIDDVGTTSCWIMAWSYIINTNTMTTPSKVAYAFFGTSPATMRCTLHETMTVGSSTFETSDDVSGWRSGDEVCITHRNVQGLGEGTATTRYYLTGTPSYDAGTGRYTVTLDKTLVGNDAYVGTHHKAKALKLAGADFGVSFTAVRFTCSSHGGMDRNEYQGVSWLTTSTAALTQFSGYSFTTQMNGVESRKGRQGLKNCSMTMYSFNSFFQGSVAGYGYDNVNHYCGFALTFGGGQFTFQGANVTNIGTTRGIYKDIFVYGCAFTGSTLGNETSLERMELSNFGSTGRMTLASTSVNVNDLRIWGCPVTTAAAFTPTVVKSTLRNIYIDNCYIAIDLQTNQSNIYNLVIGDLCDNELFFTANTYTNTEVIGQTGAITNILGAQSSLLLGAWNRISGYNGTASAYKAFSRGGIFDSGADYLLMRTNQSLYSNLVDYRILTGTIDGAKCYAKIICDIQNANYYAGTHTLPKLTATYDATLTQVDTASASTGEQCLDVIFTPSTDDQELTLTFSAKTDAGDGDGDIRWSDMMMTIRKWGYAYQTYLKTIKRVTADIFFATSDLTANPFITESTQATVHAYTGITIDGTSITISEDHTVQELYDFVQDYLHQDANLGVEEFFTTIDGENFVCTRDIILDGGNLTGGTSINCGTNDFTLTDGTYNGVIIDASGRRVHIKITGIVDGSQLYLEDTSDDSEIYNETTGTSIDELFTWTTNINAILRIRKAGYLEYSANVIINNLGVTAIASQTEDGAY
jgi:hypothetical protein